MRLQVINTQRGLRLAVANLHALLTERLLHPFDPRLPEAIDQAVYVCWEVATNTKRSPHLCIDRYCECHWLLSTGEPPRLPGL